MGGGAFPFWYTLGGSFDASTNRAARLAPAPKLSIVEATRKRGDAGAGPATMRSRGGRRRLEAAQVGLDLLELLHDDGGSLAQGDDGGERAVGLDAQQPAVGLEGELDVVQVVQVLHAAQPGGALHGVQH